MNPSPPNINPNSGEGAVPFSASNMNATLIQAFNPTIAMQTLQQVALDGVSVSDVHGLGATSQHVGHHNSSLGTQPPQMFPGLVAAQMKQFVEQHGPAQGNRDESTSRWSGTITWWGTDTTRNERREVRAQVTATASKGDPCVIFPMDFSLIENLYPYTRPDWCQHGRTSCYSHLLGQQYQWISYTIGSGITTLS
jgi:hypothetical protein